MPTREVCHHHARRALMPVHVINVIWLITQHGLTVASIMPTCVTAVFLAYHATMPRGA